MSKFDQIWNGQDVWKEVLPERITFETQVVPALGQLKAYLETKYAQRLEEVMVLKNSLNLVDSPDKAMDAVTILGKAKKLFKEMEAERKTVTAPLLNFKTGVDNHFKNYTTALTTVECGIKINLANYEARIEMERRQAEKAAQEETKRLHQRLYGNTKTKESDGGVKKWQWEESIHMIAKELKITWEEVTIKNIFWYKHKCDFITYIKTNENNIKKHRRTT
jgi:hypothetical protein